MRDRLAAKGLRYVQGRAWMRGGTSKGGFFLPDDLPDEGLVDDGRHGILLPIDITPMEAKLAEAIPLNGEEWQYEPKWDGFRCLAFKSGMAVDIRGRSGKPLGRYFPELIDLLRNLPASRFVVDGEIVIELSGHYSFEALQMRLHPAESRIHKLAAQTPAKLILFDILADTTGKDLRDKPLSVRRDALEKFVKSLKSMDIELSAITLDAREAKRWLTARDAERTDGIVAKRRDGRYLSGERAMVKVKPLRSADCVVGGFRYLANKKEVGSLLLGLYDEAPRMWQGMLMTLSQGPTTLMQSLHHMHLRIEPASPKLWDLRELIRKTHQDFSWRTKRSHKRLAVDQRRERSAAFGAVAVGCLRVCADLTICLSLLRSLARQTDCSSGVVQAGDQRPFGGCGFQGAQGSSFSTTTNNRILVGNEPFTGGFTIFGTLVSVASQVSSRDHCH